MGNAEDPFEQLLALLSDQLGATFPGGIEGTGLRAVRVVVEGKPFLISSQDAPDGYFTIHCSFGRLRSPVDAQELLGLMQRNTDLASRCAGVLSIDGPDHEIVYSCHAALGATSADRLLEGLRKCASTADAWRHSLSPARLSATDSLPHNPFGFA